MHYGNIKFADSANGPGARTVLFVSGCRHHCRGCFQPQTWDFGYGQEYTEETERKILESLAPAYIKGLTVLGGEPFEPENQKDVFELVRKIKDTYPGKSVWIYSGYTYGVDLVPGGKAYTEYTPCILKLADVLVDGEFVEEKRDISLSYRGSSNQRLIDLRKTSEGNVVLWKSGYSRTV